MKKITQYRASSGIKHGDAGGGLNESEALFRAIFDNATDGISLVEVEGTKILLGNAAFCQMLGYTPNEIKGMLVQAIHPEEELIAIMSEFMRLAGQKGGLAENIPVKRKDGHVFIADITVAYLEIGGKRYQAGFFRDVTERKQTERLLRQREADFMAIIEHAPIAKIVTGSDDKAVILMNQRFTELLGYTVEDVPNAECWWPLAYPDAQYREMVKTEWTSRVEQAMQSCGRIVPMETTVTCKDGTKRYIRFSFVSLGNKNIITCEDLTANKIMEGALRESEARYRSIFNAVDDIIFSVESDGTLASISPSFERLTGWLPSEWIGKHFSPLVYPGDQARVQALFERLLAREVIPAFPMRLMRKEGTYLDAEIKSVAIGHGESVAVFGILRDITERKRAEEIIFRRLTYENLLSRISSMALAADNLHDFLEQSIALIGEVMAVSRSYLFEHRHETDTMDNTHEWCAPGIAPHKENNQEVSSNIAPWWVSTLRSGQNICFTHIDEIPDEGVMEILRRQDIRSILVVPLFVGGRYYGFLGFDECLQHRVWPQEDIDVLLSVSRIIAVAIERMWVEEQVRRQQELTTRIIETIPMRVFWKDCVSRYLGGNTTFAKDAGLALPQDLIGKDDFQLIWQEFAELYRADDRQVISTNTAKLSYEERLITASGERIWVRTSKAPLHDQRGDVIGLLGVYEDINEQKQLELALRESEERFRMAFQTAAIGMTLVGLDGHWLKVNRSFCKIVGYSEQELLHLTFQEITHPHDLPSDLELVEQLSAGEINHYQLEKRYLHKKGHVVWVRLSVSLISDAQGNPIYFVAQTEDITERKRVEEEFQRLKQALEIKVTERTKALLEAQEELVRKEKLSMLGQVAGSVGHELRNPLGVMSNAVYFLQMVLSDADETVLEYLEIIKNEIAAADRIVGDLLDSVRTKPPQRDIVYIAPLLEQTLRKCTIPPSVTIKLDLPESLPPLFVDAIQIQQVFRNLISNGIEAMPEGGSLEIWAQVGKKAETVTINVRDHGIGMSQEQLGRLFQPLFTTKARGIGLGLVVVRNLTQANEGCVHVKSEWGVGSTFAVTLPIYHVMAG